MATLDRAFLSVLRNWGHNIVLQRKTNGKFSTNLERHTVRHMYPAARGLPQVREERPEGIVSTVDMIYYFLPEARPKEGDRIYEGDTGVGQTTFLIDYALPMRGRRGRIVYYEVGCTREEPN